MNTDDTNPASDADVQPTSFEGDPTNAGNNHTSEGISKSETDHEIDPVVIEKSQAWGRGIVTDYKQTIGTHWVEEMVNLNQKTIGVALSLFFSILAPAVTFGSITAKATHNWMGPIEMIVATAWTGIAYSLIGGQPMTINGVAGPVLALTGSLYKMSGTIGVPFLTFNAWVGLWLAFYMVLASVMDFNRLIKFATRFTNEVYALLIAGIYLVDALCNPFTQTGLVYFFVRDADSPADYQTIALLSLVLCFGTTSLIFFLYGLKHSPYCFNQTVRSIIADFGVAISLVVFTLIQQLGFPDVETESLNLPDELSPTFVCCTKACDEYFPTGCPDQTTAYGPRPWLVDLSELNGKAWVPFIAAGPGLFAFILLYLNNGLTWNIMHHPSHKLTHGDAYNYDSVILGLFVAINSILGLPWIVSATVRSLNHLHALAEKTKDGQFISVQETRLANLMLHICVLISIFALALIKLVTIPILYGVFLYMGLVTLGTNQFVGRFMMFFMQPSKFPDHPFTRYMHHGKIHLFTFIQVIMFLSLFFVKSIKVIAIVFPLVIAACIPVRMYLLPRLFKKWELILIDGDQLEIKKWLEDHDSKVAAEEELKLTGGGDDDDELKRANDAIDEEDPVVPNVAIGNGDDTN